MARLGGCVVKAFAVRDRKSTRLNSSHSQISYAVFCLKKKPPDAIVTTAAIFAAGGPVDGNPLDRFRQMIETNTRRPFRVIPAALPASPDRTSRLAVN